jgi:hypothetical protein
VEAGRLVGPLRRLISVCSSQPAMARVSRAAREIAVTRMSPRSTASSCRQRPSTAVAAELM